MIAISINQVGCDREKVFLDFLHLARAQRGLFRLLSQQGAQNGPRSPCYAYCRSRGGCRPSTTAEAGQSRSLTEHISEAHAEFWCLCLAIPRVYISDCVDEWYDEDTHESE